MTGFVQNIDKYTVTAAPARIFKIAQTHQVPLLAGFNLAEELISLLRALPHENAMEYYTSARKLFGNRTGEFIKLYDEAHTKAQLNSYSRRVRRIYGHSSTDI